MALTMIMTPPLTGKGVRPLRMFGDHDLKIAFVSVTFDSSYPSGGYTFDPTSTTTGPFSGVGVRMFNQVLQVFPTYAVSGKAGSGSLGVIEAPLAISAYYDASRKKLAAISLSAGKEFANGMNLTDCTVYLMVVGT